VPTPDINKSPGNCLCHAADRVSLHPPPSHRPMVLAADRTAFFAVSIMARPTRASPFHYAAHYRSWPCWSRHGATEPRSHGFADSVIPAPPTNHPTPPLYSTLPRAQSPRPYVTATAIGTRYFILSRPTAIRSTALHILPPRLGRRNIRNRKPDK
jgi:hypothetical protein